MASRLTVLVAALGIALLLPACVEESASRRVPDVATYTVEARDLRVTITDKKGALKARNELLVRANIPGQAKIVSLVDEGTRVKKGDVLCELDRTGVLKEIATLESRIIALRGDAAAAVAELEIQLGQNTADIESAEQEVEFAEVELERFEKGEFVHERTRRETRVEEAKSTLDRAKRKYAQMPALLEEGFVTSEQVEEERINQVKAESDLELARLDLSTYLRYTAPKEIKKRRSDVRNAVLEVERVRRRGTANEAKRRSALERQQRELATVEARLQEQRAILDEMVVRAPGDGIVIYGDARNPWEDREVKVGENVYSKQAFLTLPDLSEMQVVLAVHEADISRIEVGQRARVVVETVRDRTLEGEVTKVALVPNAQRRRWGDRQKRFRVEVGLRGDLEGLDLKPGLTSRVEIVVGVIEDAVAVPVQAVFADEGKFWVFRETAEGFERGEVSIAPGNSQYAVVTEGLSLGERIALYDPQGAAEASPDEKGKSEDGQKSRP